MITKTMNITNPTGLHTRPANRFVKEAKKFACSISVQKNERDANAKSLVKLLKLGISQGDVITLNFDGIDEQDACDALTTLVSSLEE